MATQKRNGAANRPKPRPPSAKRTTSRRTPATADIPGPDAMAAAMNAPSGNDGRAAGMLASPQFLKAALDDVQTNVFVADPTFRLIFANARALATLRGIEPEVRKAFGVGVDE